MADKDDLTLEDIELEEQSLREEGKDFRYSWDPEIFTMEGPDGTEFHFFVLGIFTSEDGTRQFMALHQTEDPDEKSVVLAPFVEGEDGEVKFTDFESEEDYRLTTERFIELFRTDSEAENEAGSEAENEAGDEEENKAENEEENK